MTDGPEPAPEPAPEPIDGELDASRRLLIDQREANARLIDVAIEAELRHDAAQAGRATAEVQARALQAQVDLREMFIGILGHGLRNPLSSILMASDALTEAGRLAIDDAALVGRIRRNAERMTRMIEQLLDLTRARLGGGMPLVLVSNDLTAIARGVVEEFAAGTVQLDASGAVVGVWDGDRLAEVVSNLVGNARQHADPGTVVVVDVHREAADAVLWVCNHGAPIPAELLPVIFAPFRSGRARASPRSSNLGLGLFISSEIVRAHGGTITAESVAGVTTFAVHLPLGPLPPPGG